jgi:hypothetical protein
MKKHRRSKIFFYTKITSTLPFIENSLNLTPRQITMFTNGLKYTIPCQSKFSRRSKKKMINDAYETILTTVQKCLGNNQMSITDERAEKAFSELKHLMNDLYRKPLSPRLYRRARRQYKQVKSLQKFLRSRPDIIICQIDKSPRFYIGDAATIELKVYEYMATTKAYKEISENHSPLADNLHAVQTLLQNLLQQGAIDKDLHDKLCPKTNKLELAHLHGLPKVHKVCKFIFFSLLLHTLNFFLFFFFYLA